LLRGAKSAARNDGRNDLQTDPDPMSDFDLVVIGAGVAGLTAAMFAARHGLKVAVIEQLSPGGQIINAETIENFPGFPNAIAGHELGPLLQDQAEAAGAEMRLDTVEAIELAGDDRIVRGAAESLHTRTVIIAAGSSPRPLGIPGEEKLRGKGVSHCASCDAPLYASQDVCVIGGGDSALDEALVLARHAARVTLIHREPALAAQQALVTRATATRNIEFLPETVAEEILGEDSVTAVRLRATGATRILPVRGVFISIGLAPNTAFLRGLLPLAPTGHIETDLMLRTSVPGIFAAGDIRAHSAAQLASAAGDGATAALSAVRYLTHHPVVPANAGTHTP
jgi:thioredoxin reductase (NADPH)